MSEIVIDLSGGWSLAPIIDGVPDPKWLSWQPPTGIEGLAAVSEFLQRLSGEIAMVRDNPIYLPGTQERNLAAEELSFQTEISPLGLHFHAVALLVALATEMIHPVHYAIARSALEKDAPGYLDHPAAVEMLAQAFQEAAADLLKFLRPLRILDGWKVTTDFDWPSFTDAKVLSEEEEQGILEKQRQSLENVWPVKDGMFVFDAAFVAWIETYLHEYGLDYANEVRESSQARWQQYSQEVGYQYPEVKLYGNAGLFVLWIDITRGPLTPGPDRGPVPARWPRGLCRTLWRAFVKAKVERLPKYPPSITGYAQHHLTMMRKPAGTRETLQGVELIDQSGTAIGHFQDRRDVIGVDGEAVQELLRSGIEQLPRLMVERLLRGWLLDVDAQAREGVNPFNRLHYEGGYSELADRYDINSKDRHVLPDVLEALAQYRAHDPWFPPVISRPYFLGETRGRRAKLWIDVGAALAPGYINQIPTSLRSPARVLYPLPFKREKLLPNLSFANNRYWPALCDLQWKMIAELRARPEESSTVGVLFGDNLVQQLALTTGLTTTLVRRALDEWSTGPDAWLRCSSSERFTFESNAALSMLRDALKIEENARRGGLASAARKRRTTPS